VRARSISLSLIDSLSLSRSLTPSLSRSLALSLSLSLSRFLSIYLSIYLSRNPKSVYLSIPQLEGDEEYTLAYVCVCFDIICHMMKHLSVYPAVGRHGRRRAGRIPALGTHLSRARSHFEILSPHMLPTDIASALLLFLAGSAHTPSVRPLQLRTRTICRLASTDTVTSRHELEPGSASELFFLTYHHTDFWKPSVTRTQCAMFALESDLNTNPRKVAER